ncbi:MAG TPA: hypothetical protein VH855_27145 [Acetobacteraceae bacterium]|jgi:hypothetical protein
MKTMVLASAAVLCLGMGAAWADQGGEDSGLLGPNTYFTELPGVVATPPGTRANDAAANAWQTVGRQPTAATQANPYGGTAGTTSTGS